MGSKSSNSAAGKEVWQQEMELVYSRQFLKLFVLFLLPIKALLLCNVDNLIQPLWFVDLCICYLLDFVTLIILMGKIRTFKFNSHDA